MIPIADTVSSRHPPVMIYIIIALNALVFLFELQLSREHLEQFVYFFGLVPARVGQGGGGLGDIWPFFTSMFIHGSWLHIIGNMWMLYLLGDSIEDLMGPGKFLLFYLISGLFAGLVHYLTTNQPQIPTVGASGAVAGVMGAYLILYPKARMIVMVPVIIIPFFFDVPAVLFLLLWIYIQFIHGFLSLAAPSTIGGIAWGAHVGGFVAGALLLYLFADKEQRAKQRDEHNLERAFQRSNEE